MPYASVGEAQARNSGIKSLPAPAKRIWTSAFNNAIKTNDDAGAAKIAWAAVSRAGYKKQGDRWVKMTDEISKVAFSVDGDEIAFGIPFSKIDVKNRTVEGFATLDNVDKADEVVDAAASIDAFSSWQGNIREMHAPKAVGKAVTIEQRDLEKDGKIYKGIHVKSRISKGAQDTWEKVLDGTLQGYSVGGKVLERVPEVIKSDDGKFAQRNVNRITKYHLGELSVVDNPMNPLALFDDITKSVLVKNDKGELVAGGAIAEEKSLLYCEACDVAKVDDADTITTECVTCEKMMTKIGEVTEAPTVTDLRKMVDSHFGKATMLDTVEGHPETDDKKLNSLGKPVDTDTPPIEEANPKLIQQVPLPEGSPQTEIPSAIKADNADVYVCPTHPSQTSDVPGKCPIDGATMVKRSSLATQKAEGDITLSKDAVDELLDQISGVLKGRGNTSSGKQKKKDIQKQEFDFVDALMSDDFGKVINPDTISHARAAMAYFNRSGQREAGGYSMQKWAEIGKGIASASNNLIGSGHSYSGGKITGLSKADVDRAEIVFNLQKNNTDGNNNIATVVQSLFGFLRDEEPLAKGGETQELDKKELAKIADILEVATKEVRDVLKGFGVQELNSEDGTSGSVGGGPNQDAGVGVNEDPDGTTPYKEVTVASETNLPQGNSATGNLNPEVFSGGGTTPGSNAQAASGATPDAAHGSSNVLPHAPSLQNADQATDLVKTVMTEALGELSTKFDQQFAEISKRIEGVENSGAEKKSAEVNTTDGDLKKSDSIWGGAFYNGEWNK